MARWHAILDGDLAARAMAAVKAIAADLARFRSPPEAAADLLRGDAAKALLWAELEAIEPEAGHGAAALEVLDGVADGLEYVSGDPGLFGFTGAGFTVEYVTRRLGVHDPETNAAIDEALLELLRSPPEGLPFEALAGVCAFALYGLERLPEAAGREIVEHAVGWLAGRAEPCAEGVRWPGPDGRCALDPAHGAGGAIGVLAAASRHGMAAAQPLLEQSLRWVESQRLPDGRFPDFAGEPPTGFGWCGAEPGLVAVLAGAGRIDADDARRVARRAAEITANGPTLCHGAAGFAHLCNRLYQATGEPELLAAARNWCARTLDLARPGTGIAGYQHFENGVGIDSAGLLFGASGIALALLAAATDREPAWDRILLLSQR